MCQSSVYIVYYKILYTLLSSDRRGHRKPCLCNNKYYEKRQYFPKKLIVSIPRSRVSTATARRQSIHDHTITSSPLLLACHYLHLLILNLQFLHWTIYVTGYSVWELYPEVSKHYFCIYPGNCLGQNHMIHEGTLEYLPSYY